MAPRIETLVNFYGYFPLFLTAGTSSSQNGSTFSTLLLTLYHNVIKYLTLGLLILIVMVGTPLSDYTSSFIKLTDESNYPIFVLIVFNLLGNLFTYFIADYSCRSKETYMKWTQIFQIFTKSKVSTKIDNSPDMIQLLTQFTRKMTINCIIFIISRGLIVGSIISLIYFRQESKFPLKIYGDNQLIEIIIPIIIIIYMVTFASLDHVNAHLFDIIVEYFVQRFRAVNDRIAIIVKQGKQLSTNNDIETITNNKINNDNQSIKPLDEQELRLILNQHDELKVNLKEYDKYWAAINVITLLIKPLICLFCVFQLIFRPQSTESILFLSFHLIESVYLFTRMFTSGTNVSDEIDAVAANGLRLILFNYSIPILQRLQLFNQHIMFTEIGFSCGGLFTFTLDSVHDAFIELTQDFLLTLDFVITVRQARLQSIN